jgi:hypothetical protein
MLIILPADGLQQRKYIAALVTGGYQDGYFIGVMFTYPPQFRVGYKVEQRNRKAQDDEKKGD